MTHIIFKLIGLPGCGKTSTIKQLKDKGVKINPICETLIERNIVAEAYTNMKEKTYLLQDKIISNYLHVKNDVTNKMLSSSKKICIIEHTPSEMIRFYTEAYAKQGFINTQEKNKLLDKLQNTNDLSSIKTIYVFYIYPHCYENMYKRDGIFDKKIQKQIKTTNHHIKKFIDDFIQRCTNPKIIWLYKNDTQPITEIIQELKFELKE